jgi:hypothetical protein
MYDPESPIQDADIEMRDLQASANRETRLRRQGICTHGWLQCPPGPASKPTKVVTCLHCGQTWATEDEAHEARREALI